MKKLVKNTIVCNYGACIRKQRIKQGYSQETLAKKTKVDRKTISRYERNNCNYNLKTLSKIFKGLKIKICKKCTDCRN